MMKLSIFWHDWTQSIRKNISFKKAILKILFWLNSHLNIWWDSVVWINKNTAKEKIAKNVFNIIVLDWRLLWFHGSFRNSLINLCVSLSTRMFTQMYFIISFTRSLHISGISTNVDNNLYFYAFSFFIVMLGTYFCMIKDNIVSQILDTFTLVKGVYQQYML